MTGSAGGPVPGLTAAQLAALAQRVRQANSPGSLDGLFAFHVLRSAPVQGLAWDVSPVTERWLEQNAGRLANAPQLAVLGYGLAHFADSPASGDAAVDSALRGDHWGPPAGRLISHGVDTRRRASRRLCLSVVQVDGGIKHH